MKNKFFLIMFLSLFVFYIIIVFASQNGYYKTRYERAKELTQNQIIEFEKDIKEGKEIDLKKYVLYEEKDYSNKVSKDIYKVSLTLEKTLDNLVRFVFNRASKAING